MHARLEFDFSMRNVREIRVGMARGYGQSRWLMLQVVGQDGGTTDIAAWAADDAAPPELVIEDDISVRRVLTIHDEEEDDA